MKFGQKLQAYAHPKYNHHYIAYKDLKKAIKLITGSETSSYTIREVTSNFGNIQALSGSIYRPPESRFQDLLNHELEKINKFSTVTFASIVGALRQVLKVTSEGVSGDEAIEELERDVEQQGDDIVFLDSYQRLNFTGFRKITKKCDKHNKSSSASWYMARLAKEAFMNLEFSYILSLISLCYEELRRLKQSLYTTRGSQIYRSDDNSPICDRERGSVYDSHDDEQPVHERQIKYLVQADDIMRVKISIAKHVPLASIGPLRSEQDKLLEEILNPLANFNRSWVSDSVYRHSTVTTESSKVTSCCVYFDALDFREYKKALQHRRRGSDSYDIRPSSCFPTSDEPLGCVRFRWMGTNNADREKDIIIEIVDSTEPSNQLAEWPDLKEMDLVALGHQFASVKQKHVKGLLDGELQVNDVIKLNDPNSKEKREFLSYVMDYIKKNSLLPSLQCWQNRTSFRTNDTVSAAGVHPHTSSNQLSQQSPKRGHASLCINIDENVRYVSEFRSKQKKGNDEWVTQATNALVSERVLRQFPFAILHISSASTAKADFMHVVTGFSSVTEVWGFSNFLHGTSLHNFSRQSSLELPHWFNFTTKGADFPTDSSSGTPNQLAEASRNDPISYDNDDSLVDRGNEEESTCPRLDVLRQDLASRLRQEHEASAILVMHDESLPSDCALEPTNVVYPMPLPDDVHNRHSRASWQTRHSGHSGHHGSQGLDRTQESCITDGVYPPDMTTWPVHGARTMRHASDLGRPLLDAAGTGTQLPIAGSSFQGHQATESLDNIKSQMQHQRVIHMSAPMTQQTTGANDNSWARRLIRVFSRAGSGLFLGSFLGNRGPRGNRGSVSNAREPAVVRVEPKTFFANERTLLQWMNTAVLLSTIAITLLNFGTPSSRIAGLVMAPVALFFIIYPFAVYLRRSDSLERKEPINYNDKLGPSILVISLVLALSTVIILNIVDSDKHGIEKYQVHPEQNSNIPSMPYPPQIDKIHQTDQQVEKDDYSSQMTRTKKQAAVPINDSSKDPLQHTPTSRPSEAPNQYVTETGSMFSHTRSH